MDDKVPPDEPLATRTEAEGATVDLPEGLGFFTTGQVLGERYEILEMLGRGGMGEVWRAFDLKLRVEVGLKALREELFQSERRLESLRQEVRAAREVVSPNVCRIFDLIEIDGRELVSMEYVDGATLLGVLQERGPLELKEAQDIASQFLSGLEAIHNAGLVHRDVKPENIMLTRAGRVVVMDFGLARGPESGAGSVSGTPAYMAPEHAAGQTLDVRADVYSAGVVLAEMVSPDGIKSYESRQSVWEGVRSEPAQVPDSPWAPVIKRAVARDRERRQNSAHTLIRELEDVTLRVEGAEDLHPYPGLASFTEEDAEYFFGREAEVERMWRKLEGPPRMLGIMGPSGAGKTSFIRAGLTPNAPPGWSVIRCTPGNAAVASLRGALTPELTHRPELLQALMTDPENPDVIVHSVAGWREGKTGALIIVDQFEEVFTLSSREDQRRFASLLGRLPLEADVHVVASMRDDFASVCSAHEALQPVFHDLVMLNPPAGGNLRRALVQPATKCGYRFEDDELVEEILAEVEGERGALPLLAFALARLWEKRDRETGLLTRQAYHDISGVGGALARHAEATVDLIGVERIPVVRELFRNLVTAEGTRAIREWDDLLSIFEGDSIPMSSRAKRPLAAESRDLQRVQSASVSSSSLRASGDAADVALRASRNSSTQASDSFAQDDTIGSTAEEVLRELIDARLLTSYEIREEDRKPIRRVEIIHESLLANWPRLVRWQTQDADSVRLRDELRQAAQTWDEHGRLDDRLWTGAAFREFTSWRERYPGGLAEIEEAFGAAMTRHATRRKRRRRLAVGAVFVALLAVLGIVGVSRQQAVAEANRAEASKLVTLGRVVLEADRNETLAYAIASLERADTAQGRRLALRALWAGPPATLLPEPPSVGSGPAVPRNAGGIAVSPDGRHIVVGYQDGLLRVFPRDGSAGLTFQGFKENQGNVGGLFFSSDGHLLVGGATGAPGQVRVWETEGWQLLHILQSPEPPELLTGPRNLAVAFGRFEPDLSSVLTVTFRFDDLEDTKGSEGLGHDPGRWLLRRWPLDGGPSQLIAEVAGALAPIPSLDLSHGLVAAGIGDELHLHRLDNLGREPPRIVGRYSGKLGVSEPAFDPTGKRLAACDAGGTLRVWSLDGDDRRPERELETEGYPGGIAFSPDGSWLAHASRTSGGWLWNLQGPARAEPLRLGIEATHMEEVAFTPDGRWLATAARRGTHYRVALWPVSDRYPRVLRSAEGPIGGEILFQPDGSRMFATAMAEDGSHTLVFWPLTGGAGMEPAVLLRSMDIAGGVVDPQGRFLITRGNRFWKVPLDGAAPTLLEQEGSYSSLDLDPTGRYLAFRPTMQKITPIVVVFDLETGERLELEEPGDGDVGNYVFEPAGGLLVTRGGVLSRWDPKTRATEVLVGKGVSSVYPVGDGRRLYVRGGGLTDAETRWILDLEDGSRTTLPQAHQPPCTINFDPTGSIVVTRHPDGEIRVGPLFSDETHLLLGHEPGSEFVLVSPDGKWIASKGSEGAVYLWPMPDLSKPPFHTLPHDDLMSTLKALTNLRAVPDPDSHTGYTVKPDFDAYRGWAEAPEW